MENQTSTKIKTLRSNDGGEYTLKAFKDFCAGVGIKRELIVLYNPRQNEVVERKNRAIVGVAKSMMYDKDLPKFLWAEACNIVVYI
jgi:transposase InsO family protein